MRMAANSSWCVAVFKCSVKRSRGSLGILKLGGGAMGLTWGRGAGGAITVFTGTVEEGKTRRALYWFNGGARVTIWKAKGYGTRANLIWIYFSSACNNGVRWANR